MQTDPTQRAEVLVYAFDDMLLVIDVDRVPVVDCAELVASLLASRTPTLTDYLEGGATVNPQGSWPPMAVPSATIELDLDVVVESECRPDGLT